MNYEVTWIHNKKEHVVSLELFDTPAIVKHSIVGDATIVKKEIKPVKKESKSNNCTSCGANKLKRFIEGGVGLLKVELGVDATDESTITDRKNICESCEHYDFGVCQKCGCFCSAKVRLKSEVCPEGRC